MSMTGGERVEFDKVKADLAALRAQVELLDISELTKQLDRIEHIGDLVASMSAKLDRTAAKLEGYLVLGEPGATREPMPDVAPPDTLVEFGVIDRPAAKRKKKRSSPPAELRDARPNRSAPSEAPPQ